MTPLRLADLSDLKQLPIDEIIDARSPSEFAEDCLPGAVNLPVLDDAERAEVGTVYVQDSKFRARKLGAAYVARNAARHIEGHFAGKDGGYRPLVYCWRGGQRSGSLATILDQIGWRVSVLEGGYRGFRRLVAARLYDQPLHARLVLLDGDTGSGKTALLTRLQALGAQVMDLEGLARHRGSVFGAVEVAQPSQKAFETMVAMALSRVDPLKPLILEAESSKLGQLSLPPALWKAMQAAPRLVIQAPEAARARFLAEEYGALLTAPASLDGMLERLRTLHGAAQVAEWRALAAAGEGEALAASLIARHYDPRYAKQRERLREKRATAFPLADLSSTALDAAAPRLLAEIEALVWGEVQTN